MRGPGRAWAYGLWKGLDRMRMQSRCWEKTDCFLAERCGWAGAGALVSRRGRLCEKQGREGQGCCTAAGDHYNTRWRPRAMGTGKEWGGWSTNAPVAYDLLGKGSEHETKGGGTCCATKVIQREADTRHQKQEAPECEHAPDHGGQAATDNCMSSGSTAGTVGAGGWGGWGGVGWGNQTLNVKRPVRHWQPS